MTHENNHYPARANTAPHAADFDGGLPSTYLKAVWEEATRAAEPRPLDHNAHTRINTRVSMVNNDHVRLGKQYEAAAKGGNVQDLTAVVRAGGSLFTVLNISTYPGGDRIPTMRRGVALVDPTGGHARFIGFIGETSDNSDGRVRVGKNHAYGASYSRYMSREQFVVGYDKGDATRTTVVVQDGSEQRGSANGCEIVTGLDMSPYELGGTVNGEHEWWNVDEAALRTAVAAQEQAEGAQLVPVS